MKVSGKSLVWEIIETDQFKQLYDYAETKVKVIKVDFENTMFSFVIKINERESGNIWLGPGVFLFSNAEIKVNEENVGKCFYLRPKLTSVDGSVSEGNVERIVQWLYSKRFRFVESRYYNYPKCS